MLLKQWQVWPEKFLPELGKYPITLHHILHIYNHTYRSTISVLPTLCFELVCKLSLTYLVPQHVNVWCGQCSPSKMATKNCITRCYVKERGKRGR